MCCSLLLCFIIMHTHLKCMIVIYLRTVTFSIQLEYFILNCCHFRFQYTTAIYQGMFLDQDSLYYRQFVDFLDDCLKQTQHNNISHYIIVFEVCIRKDRLNFKRIICSNDETQIIKKTFTYRIHITFKDAIQITETKYVTNLNYICVHYFYLSICLNRKIINTWNRKYLNTHSYIFVY